MQVNELPKMNTDNSETDCCARFEPEGWDQQELVFQDKPFVKAKTFSLFHIPINMGSVITKTWKAIQDAGAEAESSIMLSFDPSPWTGEHYFSVTKEVPGQENVNLTGTFLTKVFEGPYKDVKIWCDKMAEYASSKGKKAKKTYFYYTACPKCSKHYGKNYVVGFAQAV